MPYLQRDRIYVHGQHVDSQNKVLIKIYDMIHANSEKGALPLSMKEHLHDYWKGVNFI